MSKVQDAISWIYNNPGSSQYAAAKKFNIGQSAISVALAKHQADLDIYNEIGEEKLNEIDRWFAVNHAGSLSDAAKHFNMSPNELRAAYRGQTVQIRRSCVTCVVLPDGPVAEMREKCAMIAEQIGGEHGAAIAASIRSVEV